jgi:excisionase family DNA binding protein
MRTVFYGIMAEEKERRLLAVNEACYYLHISRSTLYHMIEREELAPVIIGGRTLFDKHDLDEFIEKAKAGTRPASKRGRKPKAPK